MLSNFNYFINIFHAQINWSHRENEILYLDNKQVYFSFFFVNSFLFIVIFISSANSDGSILQMLSLKKNFVDFSIKLLLCENKIRRKVEIPYGKNCDKNIGRLYLKKSISITGTSIVLPFRKVNVILNKTTKIIPDRIFPKCGGYLSR